MSTLNLNDPPKSEFKASEDFVPFMVNLLILSRIVQDLTEERTIAAVVVDPLFRGLISKDFSQVEYC